MSELVARFATSPQRIDILRGLISYRTKLHGLGVGTGFQLIDGSFVEDVENAQNRPPNDIDIVTFAFRPITHKSNPAWANLWKKNIELFRPPLAKQKFKCDAYYVDLDQPILSTIRNTRYWFGLFSHQRTTELWKGLIQVPLYSDDFSSLKLLPQIPP